MAMCTLHTLDHLVLSLSELSVMPDVAKPSAVKLAEFYFVLVEHSLNS